MLKKEYKCCICKKKLDENNMPIRLVRMEYGTKTYNQYSYIEKYDFCNRCYGTFNKWLNKYHAVKMYGNTKDNFDDDYQDEDAYGL